MPRFLPTAPTDKFWATFAPEFVARLGDTFIGQRAAIKYRHDLRQVIARHAAYNSDHAYLLGIARETMSTLKYRHKSPWRIPKT